MNFSIYNNIKIEYEKRQKQAQDDLAVRKQALYQIQPNFEKIDTEVTRLGLKYNKLILVSAKPSATLQKELSDKLEILRCEKSSLLSMLGYPCDYLEISYQCPQCKDTGYIEKPGLPSQKCSCFKQQLIEQLYANSNLKITEKENFSFFDETLYPNTVDENYGIKKSPRQHIHGIKDKCLSFIDNFISPQEKNLFFCGPTGVGKTFMANCLAAELINRGHTVLYLTAPALFETISNHKVNIFKYDDYDDSAYKNVFDVELLIIDDLGTESQSSSRYGELLNILNTRQANNITKPCKTVISTNINPENLFKDYTERVESRIIGTFALYKFVGEDIRKIKRNHISNNQ